MLTSSPMEGVQLLKGDILVVAALDTMNFVHEFAEKLENEQDPVLFFHLGVAGGRQEICVEKFAFNEASFRSDERGYSPLSQPIVSTDAIGNCFETKLDLPAICACADSKEKIRISCDAGRFICNYIYYLSLRRCEKKPNFYSLFVHVPKFEAIEKSEQLLMVLNVLQLCRNQILTK